MRPLAIWFTLAAFASAQPCEAQSSLMFRQQALSYADAYAVAVETDSPLVVFVESDRCAPCHAMWMETISPMLSNGDFKGMAVARVNATHQGELVRRLKVTSTPTLVVWLRDDKSWRAPVRKVGKTPRTSVLLLLNR